MSLCKECYHDLGPVEALRYYETLIRSWEKWDQTPADTEKLLGGLRDNWGKPWE